MGRKVVLSQTERVREAPVHVIDDTQDGGRAHGSDKRANRGKKKKVDCAIGLISGFPFLGRCGAYKVCDDMSDKGVIIELDLP
uniref:Uncharacterized protein n=1 Tax=Timema shepardi TaxID=629360 RepID=A0A7R9FUN8_TIMSH|nr:unnamed protein product [Timema shepardi]